MEGRDEPTVIPVEGIEGVLPEAFYQDALAAPPEERDEPLATATAS